MDDEPELAGKLHELLDKPEQLRASLLRLRETLIKAGGRPVSRRSTWNTGRPVEPGTPFDVERRTTHRDRTIRAPDDDEREPVIDVFPSEGRIEVFAHIPGGYSREEVSVALEPLDTGQRLRITTPGSTSTVELEEPVKTFEWKLNNDTLLITLEKKDR